MYKIYVYSYKYTSDVKNKKYQVMIIEKQKQDENKVVYLSKMGEDKFLLNIYLKNKYNEKDNLTKEQIENITSYTYGDVIDIQGKIVIYEQLGNIGEFNYKRYLNSKGICGTLSANKVEYVENRSNDIFKMVYIIRDKISNVYTNNLEEKQANLLKGMIYGDTRNLDEEIKKEFQNIGISHITAVSGSNLNLLLLVISVIMYKLNKRKIYVLIQIFCISIFCLISGLELSVLRASIMATILIICKYKNIKINIFKLLLITFCIMICINPFRIFNIGMIMSFLSIIGLSLFSKKIYNFFESKIMWNVKNKKISVILCKLANICSMTLAINITTIPVTIYCFNSFSLISILSNLVISFLSDSICILGIIAAIIFKIPYLSNCIFYVLNFLISVLISISNILDKISFLIKIKEIPLIIIIMYYIYLIGLATKKYLVKDNKILELAYKKIQRKIAIILIFSILLLQYANMFMNNYVYFFNVGQGEMALIKDKNTYIMVDSGSITNDTAYIFSSFAKRQKIDKIDMLVVSHFHTDHTNGIAKILEEYKVKYVMFTYPICYENQEYIKFRELIDKSNTKAIMVKEKDDIKIDNIKINVLSPMAEYIYDKNNDENVTSLVININVRNKNFLFTGDSILENEDRILNNINELKISKIDILKTAHHGSKTSTSEKFLQSILPKIAVISSKYKVYKHPSKEVVNRLNKYNVNTYITEKCGGIKYNI